nr:unnamed protein product [Callosobruchus analis]
MTSTITTEDIFRLIKDTHQEIKEEIRQINSNITNIKSELEILNKKQTDVEKTNEILKSKVNLLESKLKKYNLVIYGVEETEDGSLRDAVNCMRSKLEVMIDDLHIRDCYRIGKQNGKNKSRPIVVELISYNQKQNILIKAKKLPHGSGVYVSNDYTQEEYIRRKVLYAHLKRARESHNSAYIKNNTLYVNGDPYTYENLKADILDENNTQESQKQKRRDSIDYEENKKTRSVGEPIQKAREQNVQKSGSSSSITSIKNTPPPIQKPQGPKLRSNSTKT